MQPASTTKNILTSPLNDKIPTSALFFLGASFPHWLISSPFPFHVLVSVDLHWRPWTWFASPCPFIVLFAWPSFLVGPGVRMTSKLSYFYPYERNYPYPLVSCYCWGNALCGSDRGPIGLLLCLIYFGILNYITFMHIKDSLQKYNIQGLQVPSNRPYNAGV